MAHSISQSPKFFFETNNKNFIIETKAILSIRNKKKKKICSINWERSLYIYIYINQKNTREFKTYNSQLASQWPA